MPRGVRYSRLPTEQRHPKTRTLDQLSVTAYVDMMIREEDCVVRAIRRQRASIARAVRLITARLRDDGRLIFVGAGTSGRLGVIEAAECPPTFHTPPSLVQAIIAGGPRAVFRSQEGAEDDRRRARHAMARRIRASDVVVGISASGVTPFVDEALRVAARRGARTILITCHVRPLIRAQVTIPLSVGPEVLTGSTRLKAGTATKLVLNMLTLGSMVQLGKTYGNLMVDVRPTSRKLRARAVRIIQTVTGCSLASAADALRRARGRVKVAILMQQCRLSDRAALYALHRAHGSLRLALQPLASSLHHR
ncbi:MAG: N-acetylmuramic acid 6-phosphate etherase [Candidatus Omnitrophica bacterium]|nr:N-acetylmuramic acid 6-phosphate etherase [Candidatus Omnitrophota bacterium]